MNQQYSQGNVTPAAVKHELQPVIRALQQGFHGSLVALVLFGSRARNDGSPESDWDLLLIACDLPAKPFDRHVQLKKMLPDAWRGRISLLAKTPQELEAHLAALYLDIALDGIVLYDIDKYITKRLEKIRRLIHRQGLYREQHDKELIWRWKRYPGPDWQLSWEGS